MDKTRAELNREFLSRGPAKKADMVALSEERALSGKDRSFSSAREHRSEVNQRRSSSPQMRLAASRFGGSGGGGKGVRGGGPEGRGVESVHSPCVRRGHFSDAEVGFQMKKKSQKTGGNRSLVHIRKKIRGKTRERLSTQRNVTQQKKKKKTESLH